MSAAARGLAGVLATIATLAIGCGVFSAPAPETVARDAHRAAVAACYFYDQRPAKDHTPEADRACAQLRRVCE